MEKLKINAVIGIDPGSSNGGIAVYVPGQNVKVSRMPKDVRELGEFFAYYSENFHPIIFLEKQQLRVSDVQLENGSVNMGKIFRMEKLQANYEHLKALIEVRGIPYIMVHPLSWQTKLNLRQKGVKEEKKERKKRYQTVAHKLYPGVKATLWNSDALLLMHFGRYVLVNDPKWVRANLPEREFSKLF